MFQNVAAQLADIKKDLDDIKAERQKDKSEMDDLESLFSSLDSEGHLSSHQSPPFVPLHLFSSKGQARYLRHFQLLLEISGHALTAYLQCIWSQH